MNTLGIDYIERKMTITYLAGMNIRYFTGWVMLSTKENGVIVARKIGGRNRWSITTTNDLISTHEI